VKEPDAKPADNLSTPQDSPAADLGELWQVLDTLPQAEPPEDLLATTIEMVAVQASPAAGRRPGSRGSRFTALRHDLWQWLAPAVIVLTAIGAGFWLGQATAVVPDRDAERAAWRARREAAIQETLKNDPEARRMLREQLREAEADEWEKRPARPPFPADRRPFPPNWSRSPTGQKFRSADPERPTGPRRRFPEPQVEPDGLPPAPPAAGPAAVIPPSSASLPAE
jgi:hypothetical protein